MGLAAAQGWAHSLYVFAAAEGKTIRGKVYLRGGAGVPQAEVRAVAPNGAVLATTKTDPHGEFLLEVPFRCDYLLRATLADGHQAEWKVSGDELAGDLPPLSANASSPAEGNDDGPLRPGTAAPPYESPSAGPPRQASGSDSAIGGQNPFASELKAVHTQLVQLRQEWQQFRHQLQLRDILGGLGYILGLTGVSFYLFARKRRSEPPQ